MSERLARRTSKLETARTVVRLLEGTLLPLRNVAKLADNFDYDTGRNGVMRVPPGYTSVEALVMDVSDLAQALGYFAAVIAQEQGNE